MSGGNAPWTQEQVDALNRYQHHNAVHPYTCGNDSTHGGGRLLATQDGWVCPDCDYRQTWAHAESMDSALLDAVGVGDEWR